MKKNLLHFLSALTVCSTVAVAQPSLSGSGLNPVVGDKFVISGTTGFNPGSAGANQTWNFGTLSPSSTFTYDAVAASSTPNGASFTANIALYEATNGIYAYYNTSSSVMSNAGNDNPTTTMVYSNQEDFLRFPLAYNGSYSDTWNSVFVVSSFTFTRSGTTTVTYDGYGTLITPAGTFNNATRIHFVQSYSDTYMGGTITYTNDEYMWYSNGNHYPVALTYTLTNSTAPGSPNAQGVYLANATTTGIHDLNGMSDSKISIYPNPTSGNVINLDLNLTENLNYQTVLIDNLGREVYKSSENKGFEGHNSQTIDVSDLANGMYNFVIQSEGKKLMTKRIVVRK